MVKVVGAVIFFQQKMLIAQRARGPLAGYWEFPGGKLESGEAEIDALVREIDEELALKIEVGDRLGEFPHSFPGGQILLAIYIAKTTSAKFELHDHQAARWVDFSEVTTLQLAPADIPVLPILKQWLKANGYKV